MNNSVFPTQIGFIPTGKYNGTVNTSTIIFGKNVGVTTSNGLGFGQNGAPDYAEKIIINLTERTALGVLSQKGSLIINVTDLTSIVAGNANASAGLDLTLKEIDVCDAGVAKKMIILAGATYLP